MGDYLVGVSTAITIAVIGFPFLLAKRSSAKARRLVEIIYALALLVAVLLMGISIGLTLSAEVTSVEKASKRYLDLTWIALGVVAAAGVINWAIGQLHDD